MTSTKLVRFLIYFSRFLIISGWAPNLGAESDVKQEVFKTSYTQAYPTKFYFTFYTEVNQTHFKATFLIFVFRILRPCLIYCLFSCLDVSAAGSQIPCGLPQPSASGPLVPTPCSWCSPCSPLWATSTNSFRATCPYPLFLVVPRLNFMGYLNQQTLIPLLYSTLPTLSRSSCQPLFVEPHQYALLRSTLPRPQF